jgi:hypothetical protein
LCMPVRELRRDSEVRRQYVPFNRRITVNDNVGSNALKLAGEIFIPGASQLVSGHIGSGLVHNLLAGAAGIALVGTGVAPVIGTLAILAVKLNSFSSSVSGRSLWAVGSGAMASRSDTTSARSTTASSS